MGSPYLTRGEWGARAPRRPAGNINSGGITAHYGGPTPWSGPIDRSSAEAFHRTADHNRCATIVRAWQAFHMAPAPAGQGWNDIAYNFCFCPHGTIYECRGDGKRSGANGTNRGNDQSEAGCYIGGVGDPLTPQAKQAALDQAARYGQPLRWVHQDWKSTACPGDEIVQWKAAGWPAPNGEDEFTMADNEKLKQIADDTYWLRQNLIGGPPEDPMENTRKLEHLLTTMPMVVEAISQRTDRTENAIKRIDTDLPSLRTDLQTFQQTVADALGALTAEVRRLADEAGGGDNES